MTNHDQQYPEPENFQALIDDTSAAIIDRIYRTFTENEDPEVRAWAADFDLVGGRPTLAPVIEHFARATFRQFYQIGFQQGALAKLAQTGGLGERSIVTKHHPDGRIAEVVKIPLSIAERQALESQQGAVPGR